MIYFFDILFTFKMKYLLIGNSNAMRASNIFITKDHALHKERRILKCTSATQFKLQVKIKINLNIAYIQQSPIFGDQSQSCKVKVDDRPCIGARPRSAINLYFFVSSILFRFSRRTFFFLIFGNQLVEFLSQNLSLNYYHKANFRGLSTQPSQKTWTEFHITLMGLCTQVTTWDYAHSITKSGLCSTPHLLVHKSKYK